MTIDFEKYLLKFLGLITCGTKTNTIDEIVNKLTIIIVLAINHFLPFNLVTIENILINP